MVDHPCPWLRGLLRLPIWLYRWQLGWLLGERFMLVRHRGRKTGQQHQAVVEIMAKAPGTARIWYVGAGWGPKTDWLLNAQQEGQVLVEVGRQLATAQVSVLQHEPAAAIIRAYATRHALAFRLLYSLLAGRRFDTIDTALAHACDTMPVVAFQAIG